MNILPAIPNPAERTVAQEIFEAQAAIENWYVLYIRRENFRLPKGLNWVEFSNLLVAYRLRLSSTTAAEVLPDVQKFILAMAAANPNRVMR